MTVIKNLRAVLSAETSDFDRDMSRAARTTDQFNASAKKAESGSTAMSGALGGLTSIATKLAAAGVLVQAGQMVLGFGKASLDSAGNIEQMEGKFETVFRGLAEGVADDLGTMAGAMKRSQYDLMAFAATFQDTFVPLGFARSQAAELSVSLVALTQDLSAFNDIPAADVARDLQSALVGNTETMRKYGVVAQETQIKQKLLAMGLWDGTGAVDAQSKALAIYNLILEGTADAQGAAVREADSLASKETALAASTLNLQVAVGEKLAPAYEFFVTNLTNAANAAELLITWDDRVKAALEEHTEQVLATTSSYEDYIEEMMRSLIVAGDLTEAEADLIREYQDGNLAMADAAMHTETLMQGLGLLGEAAWQNAQDTAGMREQWERQQSLFSDTAGAAATAAENIGGVTFALKELSRTEIANQVVQDLQKAMEDGTITQNDYTEAMIDIGQNMLDLPPDVIAASVAMATLRKEFADGELTVSNYVAQAQSLGTAVDLLDGKEAQMRIILNVIGEENLEALGISPGDFNPPAPQVPAQPTALGGRGRPGETYLVGEAGPEYFVPDTGGMIVPAAGNSAAGGGEIHNHYYSEGAAALGMAMFAQKRSERLNSRMG